MADEITFSMRPIHAVLGVFVGLSIPTISDVAGTGAVVASSEQGSSQPLPAPAPSAGSGSSLSDGSGGSEGVSVSNVDIQGEPVIGSANAPVTMVWFGDFNCAFCRRFAQNTFPQVRKNYIHEGEVKVVRKAFITMGQDSFTLAKASQAAWELVGKENPDVYWKWANQLSTDQPTRKKNSKPVLEDILDTTRKVDGINADQLQQKMDTISDQEAKDDVEQGRSVGVTGTPGFIIYKTGSDTGTRIVGAQPYTRFQSAIDQTLGG